MTAPVWEDVEVERDRFGRPMIIPVDGGKPTPYTRCTTVAGTLDDTYLLGKWQQRMVALGIAERQDDMLMRIAAAGPEPTEEGPAKKWKAEMDRITEDALEAAKASAPASLGTAFHELTEKMDRGQPLGHVPGKYVPHLKAYEAATQGFSALHIERFMVQDEMKIGGTADRVITVDGESGAFIADLKTGTWGVTFGALKMAMQLATYARSQLYDPATGARSDIADEINLDRGLIIALNAKTGICELHWIDLGLGWEAVQLAVAVRRWRSRRGLTKPYGPATLPGALPTAEHALDEVMAGTGMTSVAQQLAAPPSVAAALLQAIESAPTTGDLTDLWTAGQAHWTAEHTARAKARKAVLLGAVA